MGNIGLIFLGGGGVQFGSIVGGAGFKNEL